MKRSELRNPIVFVIDMVNGFIKEGALHDPRIQEIVPAIQTLMDDLECRNVFVCDHHPPHTREFDSYPPHCLIGSSESEVVDELKPYIKVWMAKNSTNAFLCPDFQAFLKEEAENYQDFIVTGCCTDLCVLQFALSLQAYFNEHNEKDRRVILPENCVATYHIDEIHDASYWQKMALDNMAMNGISVVREIL